MNGSHSSIVLSGVLALLITPAAFAKDTIPPTKPSNLQAQEITAERVTLTWQAATDNRRIRHYLLLRDGMNLGRTRSLSFTDETVSPSTVYVYDVIASDGFNQSFASSITVTTPDSGTDSGTDTGTDSGTDTGTDSGTDTGTDSGTDTGQEPDTGAARGGTLAPADWVIVFSDEFDGSGQLDTTSADKNWRFESMHDGLHRAGNSGMDASGDTDVPDWDSVRGKRWSAWYDQHQNLNAYREDGWLVMSGYDSNEADPTRPLDYTDEGQLIQFGKSKLYTSWIDTWSRTWSNEINDHITDPDSPQRTFKYGYFEFNVDFSNMVTPGFRISAWLMPGTRDADGKDLIVDTAYDADGNNGVEIDIFEYEWTEDGRSKLQLSVHGGAAGSDALTFETNDIGVDLRNGSHTIGLLWQPDRLVWQIDGTVVRTITNPDLIPDVYSYLILSREMNSGVKDQRHDYIEPGDVLARPPYIPRDPGLYARNIWPHRSQINLDQALIDYVKIWQAP